MNKKTTIGVLGAGVMGTILIKSMVNFFSPRNILVCDLNSVRLKALRQDFPGVNLTSSSDELSKRDVIFLAVKPQDFFDLKIKAPESLVVSIMGGVKIKKIKQQLFSKKIVRAMPNTPARLGQGFIIWTATRAVDQSAKVWLRNFWKILGQEIYASREATIDKATAVTGSGPAYIFYNLLCFIKAVKKLGFSEKTATEMALSVFNGSMALIKENNNINELIKQVASKGGTTEAALNKFKELSLDKVWLQAVQAAYHRGQDLAKP